MDCFVKVHNIHVLTSVPATCLCGNHRYRPHTNQLNGNQIKLLNGFWFAPNLNAVIETFFGGGPSLFTFRVINY